jgi:hypothetical protein
VLSLPQRCRRCFTQTLYSDGLSLSLQQTLIQILAYFMYWHRTILVCTHRSMKDYRTTSLLQEITAAVHNSVHTTARTRQKEQVTPGHTSHDSVSANMCIQWTCSTADRYMQYRYTGNKYAPASESYHAYCTDNINCTTLHLHLMHRLYHAWLNLQIHASKCIMTKIPSMNAI